MAAAIISEVRIAAAHDGDAELLVTLTFPNGGRSLVTLDEFAARSLLASTQADNPDQLIGVGWDRVRDALIAASSRFNEQAPQAYEFLGEDFPNVRSGNSQWTRGGWLGNAGL